MIFFPTERIALWNVAEMSLTANQKKRKKKKERFIPPHIPCLWDKKQSGDRTGMACGKSESWKPSQPDESLFSTAVVGTSNKTIDMGKQRETNWALMKPNFKKKHSANPYNCEPTDMRYLFFNLRTLSQMPN